MFRSEPSKRSSAGRSFASRGKENAWIARLLSFMERRSLILAWSFILIGGIRIASTYQVFGNTFDEGAHIACGLNYLGHRVYAFGSEHPPLARIMIALGPFLDGARPRGITDINREGIAQIVDSGHPDWTLLLMRLGILPFFILGSLAVFFWARHHFGKPAAAIATGLFSLLPPVLAHAGLATTDMALTACLGAAFFSLILWAETPTFLRSLLLGTTAALAVLSKYTALGFLPIGTGFALLLYLVIERPPSDKMILSIKTRIAPFGIAVLTGVFVLWAGYAFSFGNVPGWSLQLPAPQFFEGVANALRHAATGHKAFLLGEQSETGWWYYFPVVLAVKTPLPFLVMLGMGTFHCCRDRNRVTYCLPLAFSLGVLAPAMASNVNIGVRHILPVYIGFSILAAVAFVRLMDQARNHNGAACLSGALAGWMMVAGAIHHPDYLSYFNELVGEHPERVLVDSDFYW